MSREAQTQIPSYARPTVASENRRVIPRSCPKKQKAIRRKVTAATLPFRFLDLPAEIRNRIYEYVYGEPEWGSRCLDLHNLDVKHISHCLPGLLQVNKQLCEEAGSYCFSIERPFKQMLDIIVEQGRLEHLMDLLKVMGRRNLERLAKHDDITIFLVGTDKERNTGGYLLPAPSRNAGSNSKSISFTDAACLVGLGRELQEINKLCPGLKKWELRVGRRDYYRIWFPTVFSTKFFVTVRAMIKGMFALLRGQDADLRDGGYKGWIVPPEKWRSTDGMEWFQVKLRSGRHITVYPVV